MDASTNLRRAVRRVAGALTEFAKRDNWGQEDYWIYYRVNSEWERLHVIFVARQFDPKEEFQNYVRVREFLAERLADDPGILNGLGLVVRSLKQVEEGGIYAIGPEYREYWTIYRPRATK